jgi:zinc protease
MANTKWGKIIIKLLFLFFTRRRIAKAAKNYFTANDCIVFLLAPQAAAGSLPSADRIKEIFEEAARAKIEPRQDVSFAGDLMDSLPPAGEILSEEIDPETDACIFSLANGSKVVLKETENQNDEIVLYAIAKGGIAAAPQDAIVSASSLSAMLGASGLGPYSCTELSSKLSGKQAMITFVTLPYFCAFFGASTTQDIKTLFEWLYLFCTAPRLDDRAIAGMIDQSKTELAHQWEDPQNVFSREVSITTHNNHPLFMPFELEDMDRVSTEQAKTFLQQCINPAEYTFVFVGNLDREKMRAYSAHYIASIPAPDEPLTPCANPGVIRPGKIKKVIYKGVDERCTVNFSWFAPTSAKLDEQKSQAVSLLSEYLGILLVDEIREKLGGVYFISAMAGLALIPDGEYSLSINFQCDPARADELITAVEECIADLIRRPLHADTFDKAKEALIMEHEKSMQCNLDIALSYANSVLYNEPFARLNLRTGVIRALSPEYVQALCRDMLVSGPVQVVMYPENWK